MKGTAINLKRRIERMERELKPGELSAAIQGFFDYSGVPGVLDPDDPRLRQGVDQKGEAFISRWTSVSFFEGTKEMQEARLEELRREPQFQAPWDEGEIPVRFEGWATCEDVYTGLGGTKSSEKR